MKITKARKYSQRQRIALWTGIFPSSVLKVKLERFWELKSLQRSEEREGDNLGIMGSSSLSSFDNSFNSNFSEISLNSFNSSFVRIAIVNKLMRKNVLGKESE